MIPVVTNANPIPAMTYRQLKWKWFPLQTGMKKLNWQDPKLRSDGMLDSPLVTTDDYSNY